MKIIIENVKCRVLVGGKDFLLDPDLMQRFREYLSIEVPGSFFANKKLHYHWDGRKYFLTPGGAMATGFLPVFLKFIEEEYPTLEVEIIDERGELPQFKGEFVGKIGRLTAFEHQKDMILALNHNIEFKGQSIPFYRGVVDGATNSGKSLVIAGLMLNLVGDQRMLIIIHRKTIYRELLEYYTSVFGEIGQVNDKEYKIKPVTLAMIQTLSRKIDNANIKKDLSQFTVLACDEVHYSGSKMYSSVLVHCPASVRIGTSGTSFDSSDIVSKMVIVGLFGPRLKTISKREMMDKGISAPVSVHIHLVNTILRAPVLNYTDCIKYLIHESIERAAVIAKIAKEKAKEGLVLITVDKISHGDFLYNYLKQLNIEVELTHSKDSYISDKIRNFKNKEFSILISTGVLKEGVNIKGITCIIYAVGLQSKISVKQFMGRGERTEEGKLGIEFHDFYDIGKFCQKYSLKRIKMYHDEELPVLMDFDLKDTKRMTNIVVN